MSGCGAGRFSWPSHVALSVEAKDLISRMLCVDVSKRITMADIQVHSVFVQPIIVRNDRCDRLTLLRSIPLVEGLL